MGAIGYYIFYAINWILSFLPLPVMYIFSDFIYLLLYYFPTYRRKVVETNLKNSFPEKTDRELKSIEKKFYRHLSDIMVETFKITHMTKADQRKHFTYSNLEIIDKLREEKRDVIAVVGHYNNWEWPTLLPYYVKYKTIIIYKPLQNKYFNRLLNKQRSKYGLVLAPTSQVIREIINYRKNNINTFSVFISDQTPAIGDIRYWTTFLTRILPYIQELKKLPQNMIWQLSFFTFKK